MENQTPCKHEHLITYIGYVNIYFCPACGLRFHAEPKYDTSIEGEKCIYIDRSIKQQ